MIKVQTYHYLEIFKEYPDLVIPEYQRAYTWDMDKVADLLDDWWAFAREDNYDSLNYYMGTLLFFQNKETKNHEVIDGQQRLTTLALIYYVLKGELLKGQNLSYNQYSSAYNITKNKKYITQRKARLLILDKKGILDRLQFTLIISDSEDNAFSFFDSQNNRGVTLGIDDYLKAYHLRALPEDNQENMATQWEAITFNARKKSQPELDLSHLFYQILFKSRKWKGQKNFPYENKDHVLEEFQKKTHKTPKKETYRLFPSRSNMRYRHLEYDNDDNITLVSKEKALEAIDFPFALRQPLYAGHNFFEYALKYNKIFSLFFSPSENRPTSIENAKVFYDSIYTSDMNIYLRHYMQLCLVAYYDSFGIEFIEKAVQHFDYFIGSLRLGKYYVRSQAVKNSLRDSQNNLLDIIMNAYLPEEIFDFIKSEKGVEKIYTEKKYLKEGKYLNHVVGRYVERVSSFYKKENDDFINRKLWME